MSKFAIVLKVDRPELVYNIPFRSSLKVARETFSKMAFCFNCSWFNRIYLIAYSHKGNKSQIIDVAFLQGDYAG